MEKIFEGNVTEQTYLLRSNAGKTERIQEAVIQGMANLIECRDGSTVKHVRNTQYYVKLITEQLRKDGLFADELDEETAENIISASPLHDVGKIRISDAILLKPGKLTEGEYEIMKLHTIYGESVIKNMLSYLEDEAYIDTAVKIAVFHHERWDGKGYPDGLAGNDIPLCARIMAVADVFDALYEERCYKQPTRPLEKVMEIMAENKNTQFDGIIVEEFEKLVPELKVYVERAYR